MKRETSKFRHLFKQYCSGNGIDIGHGTDPIVSCAITIDDTSSWLPVDDGTVEYREMCNLNLKGDARNLYWFKDSCLDYVYSSHLLEDFEDKVQVLKEWLRVLKPGGKLMLLLPDEKRYRLYEKVINPCHKDIDFGLAKMQEILKEVGITEYIYYDFLEDNEGSNFNFAIIAEKNP